MALRLPRLLGRPIGFAHRGAKAHALENTAEAFDLAVKLGATGIESDVWLSADGELMLDHKGLVGIRRRPFRTITRSELPDHVISLQDLLDRTPDHIDLSIDIKDDEAMAPLLDWATSSLDPIARSRLYLCHENWERLAEWRSADPHVKLIDSTSRKHMNLGAERRAHDLAAAGIDGVNLRYDEWSGGMATLFHRFDRLCFGWDAQHGHVLADLVRMGLDAVYSDHVDRMMDVINADGALSESAQFADGPNAEEGPTDDRFVVDGSEDP